MRLRLLAILGFGARLRLQICLTRQMFQFSMLLLEDDDFSNCHSLLQ